MLGITLAVIGAAGSVLSAYIAAKVRQVATISNGRLGHLENELRLARLVLERQGDELGELAELERARRPRELEA